MLIPLTPLVPVNSYLALYLQIYVNKYQTFGYNVMCHGLVVRRIGCQLLFVDVSLQALVLFPVDPLGG